MAAVAALLASLIVAAPTGAGASPTPASRWRVERLTPASRADTAKSATSRLAKSDTALLRSSRADVVPMVVKLAYDALATYRGGVRGIGATSPSATGGKLNLASSSARAYQAYVGQREESFARALRAAVPAARIGRSLRVVYGGVAVRAPEREARRIATLPGVIAVQRDSLAQPVTDASGEFLGTPTIYAQLGQTVQNAGQGSFIGVLDTGLWPEHPSFKDKGVPPRPPRRADGRTRPCNYGDNPLTPAVDVFRCNNKLIAGQAFLDTYNAFNDDELYPSSARDSNGHGTHTSSTAAGDRVDNVNLYGVNRGPVTGMAPGAWLAMYKVCGPQGCYSSDSTAAVEQAVVDGVDTINFSISGGSNPLNDPVELAFLDAFQAGVFVATSAGNSGPGAGTVDHVGPWTTTVAASTQVREFVSRVTLTSSNGKKVTVEGASITNGISTPTPVVLAENVAGYDGGKLCLTRARPGTFDGKIVMCQRGTIGRAEKGFNVRKGGAAGMLLYNPTVQDVETDNHWLPAVHLDAPAGGRAVSFVRNNPDPMGTFTQGQKDIGQGDVMAAFSSRGPGGKFLKPDVTAPGVQILAGNTPTPTDVASGPPGKYWQAIAGTSMSSPHVAGAAALLKALHPGWDPSAIKSALMTTAKQSVVKEDGVTPADPYDVGAGRIDLTKAGDPGLVFTDTAARMAAYTADPTRSIDLNLPSINANPMPGSITTVRRASNVTDQTLKFTISTTSPYGGSIRVVPSVITVAPGATATFTVQINGGSLRPGTYFGQVDLTEVSGGGRRLHLPVAFNRTQGSVALGQSCAERDLAVGQATTCTVTASNTAYENTSASFTTRAPENTRITRVDGARQVDTRTVELGPVDLPGKTAGSPSIGPGDSPAGYLDLAGLGVVPDPVGDETMLNFDLPASFTYADDSYSSVGISSNGYAVAGPATTEDNQYIPQRLPDPVRPNNVLAPFWTDLTGDGAPGISAAILRDGTNAWLVIQYQLDVLANGEPVAFQMWLGLNGTEDISFTYDPATPIPATPPPDPSAPALTVGAENAIGSAGDQLSAPPTGADLRVTSTGGGPGAPVSYAVRVRAVASGTGVLETRMDSPAVGGTSIVRTRLNVA